MVMIGYHASHEQHTPRELLAAVRLAELVGLEEANDLLPRLRGVL